MGRFRYPNQIGKRLPSPTDGYVMRFDIKDCTLITRMGGVDPAISARELRERLAICPNECLFHHLCETVVRPTFDDPEFPNDFAAWSARSLRDRVLAEKLGVVNPYHYDSLEQVREVMIEILDDRLHDMPFIPTVPQGEEFTFMQAVTVVFDTGVGLENVNDFVQMLPRMSNGSIYYHFIEARRRTVAHIDDFSAWLVELPEETASLREALHHVDFYYLSIAEVRERLVAAVEKAVISRVLS